MSQASKFFRQRHVVTAAHCTDVLTAINYTASDLKILFAEHDITTTRDCAFMVGGQIVVKENFLVVLNEQKGRKKSYRKTKLKIKFYVVRSIQTAIASVRTLLCLILVK